MAQVLTVPWCGRYSGHPGRLAAQFVPSGWTHSVGALQKGGDRPSWPKNATLAEAEAACEADLGCGGLTYHSADPAPKGALKMYLKDVGDNQNTDANWTTYARKSPVQVWVKPQPKGALAVYVVNPAPDGKAAAVSVDFATLGLPTAAAAVRDLWSRQDIGDASSGVLKATVEPLDSAFLLLTPK